MDAKSDEAIFMGYALHSKAYRVFNNSSLIVEQSMHIIFETNATPRKVVDGDDAGIENTKEEEPRNIYIEESKDEPPLKAFQRKEINMRIYTKHKSSLEIISWIKLLGSHPRCKNKRASRKLNMMKVGSTLCQRNLG